MAIEYQIADTDRLLDELELAARSDISNTVFYDQLLASLRVLVLAESSAIVLHLKSSGWVLLAQSGEASIDLCEELIAMVNNNSGEDFLFMHREMIKSVNAILAQARQAAAAGEVPVGAVVVKDGQWRLMK